jgi:hypothetical protein
MAKGFTFFKKISLMWLVVGWTTMSLPAQFLQFKNNLRVDFKDIKLETADTTITIRYDLKGFRNRLYNTRLFYSNNRGNSFKGPLRSISGDIGDSTKIGNDKEVRWSFRQDNPYFDGKNIMFKIEATEIPKVATGGPSNALRSMLMPGLGDVKVRNGYNYGYIAAASYACLGTGAFFYVRSLRKQDDHLAYLGNGAQEHDNFFNQARNARNLAIGFFAVGAGIWIGDVIGVYFRGLKNKRRIQAEKEKAAGDNTSSLLLRPRLIPITDGQSGSLLVQWKF